MKQFLKYRFIVVLLLILLLLCGILSALLLDGESGFSGVVKNAFAPAQRMFYATGEKIEDVKSWMHSKEEMQDTIDSLQKQLKEQEQQISAAEETARQNAELQDFLQLKREHTDFQFVDCHVQSVSAGNYETIYTLDRGKDWGIEEGMPVLCAAGLIGTVTSVKDHSCQIKSVLEKDISIGVYLQRTGLLGVTQGELSRRGDGAFLMTGLSYNADIVPGDVVCTTGAGGRYPRGISVGTVTAIAPDSGNAGLNVTLMPVSHPQECSSLMVLTSFSTKIE